MADPITTFSVRRGKTSGTPGPWEVVERSDTWNVKAGNRCIARLQKKAGAETDAHNIAALPDLLEALEALEHLASAGVLAETKDDWRAHNYAAVAARRRASAVLAEIDCGGMARRT